MGTRIIITAIIAAIYITGAILIGWATYKVVKAIDRWSRKR